jgi:hypothetical protein
MANINSTSLRNNLVQSLTMSGNLTWAKADFKGKFTVFISTNSATTRTLTISNTGFVAGDFICLLINNTSSGLVTVNIGTRAINTNKANIINAIFDGTNWNVWSGGGLFNTSSILTESLSLGQSMNVGDNSSVGVGALGNVTGNQSAGVGVFFTLAGGNSVSLGHSTNIQTGTDSCLALGMSANINSQSKSIALGAYAYNRRYGTFRTRLDNNQSSTDATNPSRNKEWATWNGTTVNATITEIFLRGVSSNRCVLQAKNVLKFRGQCTAFRSDYSGSAGWDITGLIKRDGSNVTTLIGVTATLTHSDGTGGTLVLTISADDTNESLRVQVTGNASETWTWLVELELLDLRIA